MKMRAFANNNFLRLIKNPKFHSEKYDLLSRFTSFNFKKCKVVFGKLKKKGKYTKNLRTSSFGEFTQC